MPKIALSKSKKRATESRSIKCSLVSIKYAYFIQLKMLLFHFEPHNAVESIKNNIATEEKPRNMKSKNATSSNNLIKSTINSFVNKNIDNTIHPSKMYNILQDIDLDKNYNETKPSILIINIKNKKKIAEDELIRCLIASINSANFIHLDKLSFYMKPKAWDANGPKIKLEFNNQIGLEPFHTHKNLFQGYKNSSND